MLLRGVNDDPKVMMKLMHELLKARVRPYYIYMADQVAGGEHFRTTVQKGLEIIQALGGWTSGLAVPQFVIDAPGGGGARAGAPAPHVFFLVRVLVSSYWFGHYLCY